MRKLLFLFVCLPLSLMAQMRFGYFNYGELLQRLPEYSSVTAEYQSLLAKCDAEILHNEEELTRSYVAFLDGQSEFPEPILRKRQKELQELVDKSVIFRDQLKQWLAQAHDSLYAPLHATIDDAVGRVCMHNNLAYAINVESTTYTFINPNFGCDITDAVLAVINNQEVPTIVHNLQQSISQTESQTADDNTSGGVVNNDSDEKHFVQ